MSTAANNTWSSLSNEIANSVDSAGKSVGVVHARHRHAASAILWDDGIAVTADHVISRGGDARLALPGGKVISAQIAGRDPRTDIAVLKLEPTKTEKPVWSADSALRVGELVAAVARTRRGNVVASAGIVSGLMGNWRTARGGEIDQFIRPDLTFYPGFSGGLLINSRGQAIGMNTAALHRAHGLTIPYSTLKRVVQELLEKGHIERPQLGVGLQPVRLPESVVTRLNLKGNQGLVVVFLQPGGAAEQSGVLIGDVWVEIQSQSVSDVADLQALTGSLPAGRALEIVSVRANDRNTMRITPELKPAE